MREKYASREMKTGAPVINNNRITGLFEGVIEATEEAILNSLFMASEIEGYKGHKVPVLPKSEIAKYGCSVCGSIIPDIAIANWYSINVPTHFFNAMFMRLNISAEFPTRSFVIISNPR